jgi:hypothetical protein
MVSYEKESVCVFLFLDGKNCLYDDSSACVYAWYCAQTRKCDEDMPGAHGYMQGEGSEFMRCLQFMCA